VPSIFDGEAFPDFIDPLVEGIEPCVQASVVKVEYVPAGQKSENPVMRFHIEQHLLDRMTDSNYNVPQDVHRIPRSKREDYHDRQVACSGPQPFAMAANQSTVGDRANSGIAWPEDKRSIAAQDPSETAAVQDTAAG
jgi:hypothetical protein